MFLAETFKAEAADGVSPRGSRSMKTDGVLLVLFVSRCQRLHQLFDGLAPRILREQRLKRSIAGLTRQDKVLLVANH